MGKPSVLFVYYTYTKQARRVSDAMTRALREDGCEVTDAEIEFTDKRWAKGLSQFPMRHPFLGVLRMLPAQLRRATGEIKIPEAASRNDYDLVIIGSPTWWLTTSIPVRSFLKSSQAKTLLTATPFAGYVVCRRYFGNNQKTVKRLGTKAGGRYLDGLHYAYEGRQIKSLLSLISYLGSGEYRERFHGVKIPPTNLPDGFEDSAVRFARGLEKSLSTAVA